jgi:hypothetical protein
MAANPIMSMGAARAALDAALALLNAGGAGSIKIFTGSMPSNCGAADTGTLLAQLTLSATAFPASADGGSNGLATATANAITSDSSADNTGTAGYFRAYSGAGTCIIQGTCGTSAADLILNTTSIVAGAIVAVTSWVVTLPDGSGND